MNIKIKKLNALVERVCGIYTRVARRLGVHRTFVSRVARGERRSEPVENALINEYEQINYFLSAAQKNDSACNTAGNTTGVHPTYTPSTTCTTFTRSHRSFPSRLKAPPLNRFCYQFVSHDLTGQAFSSQ